MFDLLLLIVIGSRKKPIWMFQTTEHCCSILGCYVSAKTKTQVLTASCPSIKEYCNSQNSFNFQSRMCTMRRSTITASLWCNLNRFFFSFSKIERKREFFELWFYATDCKRKWVRQFLHNCNQKRPIFPVWREENAWWKVVLGEIFLTFIVAKFHFILPHFTITINQRASFLLPYIVGIVEWQ